MMSRRSFTCLAVAALAVAALFVAAEPSSAQFRRGFSAGYGNPYSGGYDSGSYFNGRNFYPGSSGWYAPEYRGPNTDFSAWGVPSYYGEGMQGSFSSPFTGAGFGSYGAFSGVGTENNALINVRVPANAEVWFDDQRTAQTGSFRSFVSPALESDRNLVYHIRARWTEDGRQVEKVRNIEVNPGDRLFVNFIKPMRETSSGQFGVPGQFGTDSETRGGNRSFERRDNTQQDQDRN